MTSYDTINANAKALIQFISYLNDVGLRGFMTGAVMEEYDVRLEEAAALIQNAVSDIYGYGAPTEDDIDKTLTRIIDGAISLVFLVGIANDLEEEIMPPALIPSDEVLSAALEAFHERRKLGWLDNIRPAFGPNS